LLYFNHRGTEAQRKLAILLNLATIILWKITLQWALILKKPLSDCTAEELELMLLEAKKNADDVLFAIDRIIVLETALIEKKAAEAIA